MNRAINNIRSLHNPVCLIGVAMLALVRGAAFISTATDMFPLDEYDYAPSLPGVGVAVMGGVWVLVGLFLLLGMAVRRLFLTASALMVGMYATCTVLYAVGVVTGPDWDMVLSLSVYVLMVFVMITLASTEVDPPGEASISEEETH